MTALPAYMTVAGSHPTEGGVALNIVVDPKHPAFIAEVRRSARALAARNGLAPDDVTLAAALDEGVDPTGTVARSLAALALEGWQP